MPELWGTNEDYQFYRKMPADYHRKDIEALRHLERDRATAATPKRTHYGQGILSGLRVF
jgi:hypothetical protein